jgi:GxxExxY protein
MEDEMLMKDHRDEQTYAIIGAAMEVHKTLGHGFLEAVYQEALELEMLNRNIPFTREHPLPIYYHGIKLRTSYRADFICYGEIIVELKALSEITGTEISRVLNYLKASGLHKALLLNFGVPSLFYKRFVL